MNLAAVILIIFLAFLFLKSRTSYKKTYKARQKSSLKNKTTPRKSTQKTNAPYRAVSIEFGSNACSTVQMMIDKYFLVKEAPLIPLKNCQSTACCCKYTHHNDRRNTIRRPQTLSSTIAYESTGILDRRVKRGRCETDWLS